MLGRRRLLVAAVVRGWAGAGAARVFFTSRFGTFAATAARACATTAALSLRGQRQALQLAQVEPRQADGRFQVFVVLACGRRVALGLGLLRQQPVVLPGGLDLRLPILR